MELELDQHGVARALEEIALLLDLKGENPFRVRAFRNAARVLAELSGDFADRVARERLAELPGIGEALARKITLLAQTGKLDYLQELRSEFPETLFELFKIPGLGPKKIRALYEKLDVISLKRLEEACRRNRVASLAGFGVKTQEKLLAAIEHHKRNQGRFLFPEAWGVAETVRSSLSGMKEVGAIEIAGSLRRRKETVADADLVCSSAKPEAVMKRFVELPGVVEVIARGETKSSVRWFNALQVDLRVVSEEEFPFALHHFTGSREHNTALRSLAKKRGLKMNEYGLFKGKKRRACGSEEELFRALGLSYIPPELREDRGEIPLAAAGRIPKLVEESEIRGVLHLHTTYSDGRSPLNEMVATASELGLEYLGVADHSQSAFYAGGLKEADLERQWREIDRLGKKFPKLRIFKGIESDILPDGSLDYPERVLKRLDFVVGSVHSHFSMPEREMTERCRNALSNPYCTILGHPTGRLLLLREGFKIDLAAVIDEAAERGKIVELNSHPQRLDLDWRFLPYAKGKKVPISINPDAHDTEGFADVGYGVGIARKGGLRREDVLNTRSAVEVEKRFRESRRV